MTDVQFTLNDAGKGRFYVEQNGERLATMEIGVSGNNLTVYHTEVSEKLKGQGVAAELLSAMVVYVRQQGLKVILLCPYVLAQFKRHPHLYEDIWNQHWHS